MSDVLEHERRVSYFRRPSLGAIIACVLAFGASAEFGTRALNHWVGIALGVSLVVLSIAPALREISDSVQRWTMTAGSVAVGAALGFLFRLFTR